jgi:hypothetical protein
MYGATYNVEHELYDCTANNWMHRLSNKGFKEKFVSNTRKSFNGLTTKDGYNWNITHNAESTAV